MSFSEKFVVTRSNICEKLKTSLVDKLGLENNRKNESVLYNYYGTFYVQSYEME